MDNFYDVVIVGGGPAGLTSAIYLARANYRVLVIEKEEFGGQIRITDEVVNYPGIVKTSGKELTDSMKKQASNFGGEFLLAEVLEIKYSSTIKEVKTTKGSYKCFGIIIATGAHPRHIGFKGEDEFKGKGVAYCATCDGEFFKGKEIYVIGGGFAAAEEAVFLTKYGTHVHILVRGDNFTCPESVYKHALDNPKIEVIYNASLLEVNGTNKINYLKYFDSKNNKEVEIKSDSYFGVFVFAGYDPETKLVKGLVDLSKDGYILTDKSQKTSKDGIYAAGDVCVKPLRQVVTATGEGSIAATELEKYCSLLQKETNIYPKKENLVNEVSEKKEVKSEIFSSEIVASLAPVFQRMENSILLKVYNDNSSLGNELENYIKELVTLSSKLKLETISVSLDPHVEICSIDGTSKNISFHGVPAGHEFTSFILSIYNCSGKGQPIDEDLKERILSFKKDIDIKLVVSLSCTMCPDLVTACGKIVSLSKTIKLNIFDIAHNQQLKDKYNIMSVPCMIINDSKVSFGKKNIPQLLDILEI